MLIAFALGACSSTEPADEDLPGTYALVTMNGWTPQQIRDANGGWGTKSVILKIEPDGRFFETVDYLRPPGYLPIEEVTTFPGEWTGTAGRYDFVWSTSRTFPAVGTLSGRTLTLRYSVGAAEHVYRKL